MNIWILCGMLLIKAVAILTVLITLWNTKRKTLRNQKANATFEEAKKMLRRRKNGKVNEETKPKAVRGWSLLAMILASLGLGGLLVATLTVMIYAVWRDASQSIQLGPGPLIIVGLWDGVYLVSLTIAVLYRHGHLAWLKRTAKVCLGILMTVSVLFVSAIIWIAILGFHFNYFQLR